MRKTRTLLGIALVMTLLAACGGGSGDATTTTQPQATTTTADATTTTDGGGGPDGGLSEICIESSEAMAEAMEGYGQSFGAPGAEADWETLADQLQAAADAAPGEIREDFQVLARELGKFYEAMGDFDFTAGQAPTPEQLAQMQAAIESVDQEALETASANLEAWFEDQCS